MPTPFPGMDPYLERPSLWVQIHASLIVDIQRFLTPLLRPRYKVAIEQHTYLTFLPPDEQSSGIPDILLTSPIDETDEDGTVVAQTMVTRPLVSELPMPKVVTERYLEVRDAVNKDVITVIEVLSPANKKGREGRAQYERKRLKILASLTNLVEIDLIRAGKPFPMKVTQSSHYRIVVSRGWQRPKADIYLFGVRDEIPDFPIPLEESETEPVLPLNQILHDLYDLGGYDLAIDYNQKPEPLLTDEDAKWAKQILKKRFGV
jgi:hypothetical protein